MGRLSLSVRAARLDTASERLPRIAMIEAVGFDVIEAASADDAIKILEARRDITMIFRCPARRTT
jgi:hypothetical protein